MSIYLVYTTPMVSKHKYFIYGLIDPTTNQLRYIGRTNNPEKRLKDHIDRNISEGVSALVDELKRKGEKPHMVILQECDDLDPSKTEASWIRVASLLGSDLVNGEATVKGLIGIVRTREMYNALLADYRKVVSANEVLKNKIIELTTGINSSLTVDGPQDIGVKDAHAFLIENN